MTKNADTGLQEGEIIPSSLICFSFWYTKHFAEPESWIERVIKAIGRWV